MADTITATFHYGDDKTVTKEYTVSEYISTMKEGFRGWVVGYQWSPINNTIFDVFYMYGRTVDTSHPFVVDLPGGERKKIFRLDFSLLF